MYLKLKKKHKKKYFCWDGQHRRKAIQILQDEPIYYPVIRRNYIVHIYKNDTEEGIIKKFISINKSVPVPRSLIDMLETKINQIEPTTTEHNIERKMVADSISYKLSNKYSEYCKKSDEPKRPNFNMSNLNGDILSYILENEIDITSEDLLDKIELLNISMGNKYNNTRQNETIVKRLDIIHKRKMKCYLFVESDNFTDKLNYV